MSTITGKVLSVALNVDYPKQAGGSYPAWVLSYVTPNNEKRDIAKHMNSLKFGNGPKIRAVLEDLKAGDVFTAEAEKKGEFNEIVGMVKGEAGSVDLAAQTAVSQSKFGGKVVSTYETAEERKLKQRLIVRQSSIGAAIAAGVRGVDILPEAAEYEAWVYRGLE